MCTMSQVNLFIRLKQAREKVGISQKEIADRIGVSTNTIQSWEKDTYPKGDALVLLSEILDCSTDWLLKGLIPGNPLTEKNTTSAQHNDIINQFKNQAKAKSINEGMVHLEKLNPAALDKIEVYVRGMLDGIQLNSGMTNANALNPSAGEPMLDANGIRKIV